MLKHVGPVFALSAALAASGCGGGGQSSLPTAGQTHSGVVTGSVKVQLSIKIPVRTTSAASSGRRSPKYVSSSTKEIAVRAGTTADVSTAAWQLFDVSANATLCTTDPASSVRTCVLGITAPAVQGGTDEFIIDATDTAPLPTDTQPAGNILSTGDTTQTVTLGAANAVGVALTSVIGKLAVAKPLYTVWAAPGTSANVVAAITANDIDGGQIFGNPASFDNPIAFADTLAASSPFTYPSATPPTNYGLPPPASPGPVLATIGYHAPTAGTTGASTTVTVNTVEPSYLPVPAVPPSATFALNAMVVSVGTAPIGSLSNLVAGTQTLVTVSEPGAVSFTVSDNATTTVTLLNSTGTAPLLPGTVLPATSGTASFIVSAVGATPATAAATVTITDANGTVATLPLVIT